MNLLLAGHGLTYDFNNIIIVKSYYSTLINLYNYFGRQFFPDLVKVKIWVFYDPLILSQNVCNLEKLVPIVSWETRIKMSTATLFMIGKKWKQLRCLSTVEVAK